jgi:hypothetical protein
MLPSTPEADEIKQYMRESHKMVMSGEYRRQREENEDEDEDGIEEKDKEGHTGAAAAGAAAGRGFGDGEQKTAQRRGYSGLIICTVLQKCSGMSLSLAHGSVSTLIWIRSLIAKRN